MVDEVFRQGVEQAGVRWRVREREVVDGLDQPDAEVVGPDAVDEAAGEVRIVRRPHPLPEFLSRVAPVLEGIVGPPSALAPADRPSPGGGTLADPLPRPVPAVVDEHLADRVELVVLLTLAFARRVYGIDCIAASPGWHRGPPAGTHWRRPGSRPASSGRSGACGIGHIRGGRPGTRPPPSRPTFQWHRLRRRQNRSSVFLST